jgi:hypothetical protein
MLNIPYNTGKVKIGLFYQPVTYTQMSNDEIVIQRALLNIPPTKSQSLFQMLFGSK